MSPPTPLPPMQILRSGPARTDCGVDEERKRGELPQVQQPVQKSWMRQVDEVLERCRSQSTPYITPRCILGGQLLPDSHFREVAGVTNWREAAARRASSRPATVMRHQHNRRSCVDKVLESMLSWCTSRWEDDVRPLTPVDERNPEKWREPFPETEDGYVTWQISLQYFNSLDPKLRGDFQLVRMLGTSFESLTTELQLGQPVMIPYMSSPIPLLGRALARGFIASVYPLERLVYWSSLACGRSYSPLREFFLNGEDDIHEHYPHTAVVVGVFERRTDGEQLVLMAEPWGGDWLAFSRRSYIFEVLTRKDFEARWLDWAPLRIPPKIRAKWRRLVSPGALFVLR